jgi:hypothetical protein
MIPLFEHMELISRCKMNNPSSFILMPLRHNNQCKFTQTVIYEEHKNRASKLWRSKQAHRGMIE